MIYDLALELANGYENNSYNHFRGSPFFNLIIQPPATKGKIGETLIKNYCQREGIECGKASTTHYDLVINGLAIEMKTSFINGDNKLVFQQIRINHEWDFVIFLGFYPDNVKVWCLSKSYVTELFNKGIIVEQHSKENLWVWIDGYDSPDWLIPKSGDVIDVMNGILI
jgi:hypothetical protein